MQKKRSEKKHQAPELKLKLQPENTQARKMMWGGVGIFILAILVIWGWSIKIKIDNLKLQKTPESELIQKSKQEWNAIFDKNSLDNPIDSTPTTSSVMKNVELNTSTTNTTTKPDIIKNYLEKIMTTSTKTSSTNN